MGIDFYLKTACRHKTSITPEWTFTRPKLFQIGKIQE